MNILVLTKGDALVRFRVNKFPNSPEEMLSVR